MVHWMENEKFTKARKQRLCQKLGISESSFRLNVHWLINVALPKVLDTEDGCTITFHSPDIHRDFPRKYWLCRIEPTRWCIGIFGGWVSQEENKTLALALVKAIAVAYQVW
ncbi:hypothetical protein ES703_71111 [subsurface metagenome]